MSILREERNTLSKPDNYISRPEQLTSGKISITSHSDRSTVVRCNKCREFSVEPSPDTPQVDRETFNETSLEAIVDKWNQPAGNETLSAAQRNLCNHQTNKTIYMAAGGRGYLDECAKFCPDWTGNQPTAPQLEEVRQISDS